MTFKQFSVIILLFIYKRDVSANSLHYPPSVLSPTPKVYTSLYPKNKVRNKILLGKTRTSRVARMKIAIETFPVRRIRAESASCPMRAPTNDTLPYHKANCQSTAPISEYCSVIADALNNLKKC